MINIIALRIVSDLAEGIRKNGYFSLMADECTDVSNKEQLAICLRHVDHNLVAHEEFIGFYHIPNIFSDTIVSVIKDVLLRMNLSYLNVEASVMMELEQWQSVEMELKLIKFSPKREGILNSIKADIHMDTPGIKMLCPTRWTVQGESFERIKDNYEALMLEWDICLEERLDMRCGLV